MEPKQFDFGKNWEEFSEHALTPAGVDQARRDFAALLEGIPLRDRSFLDIGFGQGLSLLLAASAGARAIGCDVNPLCVEVIEQNRARFFPELAAQEIPVVTGSILDPEVIEKLRALAPDQSRRSFDVVHAWGSLHHTGAMTKSVRMAAPLVAPDGCFIVALYARHWSSPLWRIVKRLYARGGRTLRRLLIGLFYPVVYIAKWLVTRRNPSRQERGMDFYYDL